MKRIATLAAALLFMAGLAGAVPSMYGSNGLIMTIKPTNCGPMSYGLGAHGFLAMDSETYGTTDVSWRQINMVGEGYFSINDMLEFSLAPGYRMDHLAVTPSGGAEVTTDTKGVTDTRIGLKATFLYGEGFNLGAYLGYDYRSGRVWNPYVNWDSAAGDWVTTDGYSAAGNINFLLIPGFKSDKFEGHLNIGANYNLDKFEVGGTDYLYPKLDVPFGIGLSYDAGVITPMLEITGTAWVNDSTKYPKTYVTTPDSFEPGLMNYPLWITPGLRFALGPGFHFDLGFAYNLQTSDSTLGDFDKQVDWMAIAGLSFSKCNLGPKVPPTAIITGKVTDKAGKALAAVVTAAGLTANTDPATGTYQISGVEIKNLPVEIKAEAKAYIAKASSVMLTKKYKKTPAVQDFVLELKPIPPSEVTGTVIDYKTGNPVAATITFKGPKTVTATADAAGKYSIKLDPGTYAATAAAEGFNNANFNIVAKDGAPVTQNTGMVKKKEKFSFSNINFAPGKSNITPEMEAALQPLLKVLLDNPELKVEISGHTDNIGSKAKNLKLSQARADEVVAWLITQNVKAQMIAKGYGSSTPIATNKTRAGRAENRRIEINVIEQ